MVVLTGKRILIADDDPSIRRIVQIVLSHHGLTVITAEDGEDAFQKAITEKPDAILLDIRMPKLNGFEVFEKLRANPLTAHIPVAFFTADKDFTDFRKAQEMGSLIYISKPFKPNTLIDSVTMLLASNKRRRTTDI